MHWRNLLIAALLLSACANERIAKSPQPTDHRIAKSPIDRARVDELNILANLSQNPEEKFRAFYELYKLSGAQLYLQKAAINYSQICLASSIRYGCGDEEFANLVRSQIPNHPAAIELEIKNYFVKNDLKNARKLALDLIAQNPSSEAIELAINVGVEHKKLAKILDTTSELNRFYLAQSALANEDFKAALKYSQNSDDLALKYSRLQALIALEQSPEQIILLARELEPQSQALYEQITKLLLKNEQFNEAWYFAQRSNTATLQIAIALKKYLEAASILRHNYLKSHNKIELAFSYFYELLAGKDTTAELDLLLASLPPEANLLNSYGYFLIDSGKNPERGLNLVREALQKEPQNPYFMDSLAWGLFRQGRCDEALLAIERALEIGIDKSAQAELNEHYKEIKKCKN